MKNKDYISAMRHSTEHVLTMAMIRLYGEKIIMAMGPSTEDGFYFDFESRDGLKISEDQFPKIEEEMEKIIHENLPFVHEEMDTGEARKLFINNPYKLEWLDEIEKRNEKASIYKTGEFTDLCSGPHISKTGDIRSVKLLSLAGAYWHGSEKNKMLTRIYGTAFPTQKELDDYLMLIEEAKKRDHRKIGEALDLFTISEEVGKGLILWLPKGNVIKEELESFAKDTETEWGYQRVTTPNITKSGLYYTSGHLPYYKGDMYPAMKLDDGDEYFLKPMNCPHHHMIFASRQRSYKDLPLRLAEYGTCYRYEASGELFGMMRVRGFTQNDSHIYCSVEDAVEEFLSVMKLHEYYYKIFGIEKYHLELSLRDPKDLKKYHGDESMWELAEKLMREAAAKTDIPMVEKIGGAAFYGPKIDFVIHSAIGREFAISTNQIDLFMGKRFKLSYIDNEGKEQTPVIIHRAPLGSHERFIGFLIEHYAGNFPTWLNPVQVKVLPIADRHMDYAKSIVKKLKDAHIRVELDDRKETLQAKIRDAQMHKVCYMLILGDKEVASETVAERGRSGKDYGQIKVDEFIQNIRKEIDDKVIT